MKIYYEFEPSGYDDRDALTTLVYELWKYEYMWTLRHLEKEMEKEGGVIIVSVNNKYGIPMPTNNFSEELSAKIAEALHGFELKFSDVNIGRIIMSINH